MVRTASILQYILNI